MNFVDFVIFRGCTIFCIGKESEAVFVSGAKGLPPTDSYKISATYADGYRLTAVCLVFGGRAVDKARRTADAIIMRYSIWTAAYVSCFNLIFKTAVVGHSQDIFMLVSFSI